MNSRIEELVELLPPPSTPRNNQGDWSQLESSLGTRLPTDFKDFTGVYGTVKICNYLMIHTPFPFNQDYTEFLRSLCQEYDNVTGGRQNIPFPFFPKAGGLFGIGGTDNSDIISWITEGDPDDWGIFFWEWPGELTFTFKELNLTGFLVELASMRSPLFPGSMPPTFFSEENRSVVPTN